MNRKLTLPILWAFLLLAGGNSVLAQCHAHFHNSSIPGSTTVAFVNSSQDSGMFQSFWSFGDGNYSMAVSPVHTYAQGGIYLVCLTIYNPTTQCSDTECKQVWVMNQPNCMAFFKIKPDSVGGPGSFRFQDLSQGQSNILQRYWSFGDGASSTQKNPQHQYQAPGSYQVCLSITSQDSCTDVYCDTLHVGAPASYNLGGQVFAGNNLLDDFDMIIYRHTGFAVQVLDTLRFDTLGYYYFFQLPAGPYFLKAQPRPGSQYFNSYMPTYQGNEVLWSNCQPYQHSGVNFAADINLKALTAPAAGNGRISGRVFSSPSAPPGPLPRVAMILFDPQWVPRAYTLTDSQGGFSFNQLASGTYNVFPELTGIPGVPATITLSSSSPLADSVNFSLGQTITALSDDPELLICRTYPNPCSESLTVEIDSRNASKDLSIEIVSTAGRVVTLYTLQAGEEQSTLDVSGLESGLYFLRIRLGQELIRVEKVLKL